MTLILYDWRCLLGVPKQNLGVIAARNEVIRAQKATRGHLTLVALVFVLFNHLLGRLTLALFLVDLIQRKVRVHAPTQDELACSGLHRHRG